MIIGDKNRELLHFSQRAIAPKINAMCDSALSCSYGHTELEMKRSTALIWLSWLTGGLTLVAATAGLFIRASGVPFEIANVRGDMVEIYGQGLYFYDSLFSAAGFRGTDLITLVIALPLLVYAILAYRSGSLRGGVLLTGVLSYFLYYAASMAFGVQYNNLLLVYTAMLTSSLSAFVIALESTDAGTLDQIVNARLPRHAIGRFLVFAGVVLVGVWLSGLLPALLTNTAPNVIGHYTTIITYPIDLGIIAPACIVTGILLLRRRPLAMLFISPLLVLCSLIGIVVIAQTIFQVNAGVDLTAAEIMIYVVSFMLMATISGGLVIAYLRSIPSGQVASSLSPSVTLTSVR